MLVMCPYPEGIAAGQRLKYEQYLGDWRDAGWEVTVSPFMDRPTWDILHRPGRSSAKAAGVARGMLRRWRDLVRLGRFDLVYIFMNVTPVGTSLPERIARRVARRVVYDIEDDMLGGGDAGPSVNPIARLLRSPAKARVLVRSADHVITASPFMVDRYRALNEHGACTLIPPSVDTDRFVPKARPVDARPVIGWTGTFSSAPYLDLLRPVFQELARRIDFQLRVIGNFDYSLPGVELEVVRWSVEREAADMQAIDIGVYPLPVDDWVLGKAGLKVIQYMSFGIASVSTAIGAATLQVRDGETGYLVRTPEEWLDRLERLVRDPALRERIGRAARAEAVQRYSRQVVAGRYRAVLDTLTPPTAANMRRGR